MTQKDFLCFSAYIAGTVKSQTSFSTGLEKTGNRQNSCWISWKFFWNQIG